MVTMDNLLAVPESENINDEYIGNEKRIRVASETKRTNLCFSKFLKYRIQNPTRNRGTIKRKLWYEYNENKKNVTAANKNLGFFKNLNRNKTPVKRKNKPIFPS